MKETMKVSQTQGALAMKEDELLEKIQEAGESVYVLFKQNRKGTQTKKRKNGTNF